MTVISKQNCEPWTLFSAKTVDDFNHLSITAVSYYRIKLCYILTARTKLPVSTPSDLQYNKPGSVGRASGNAIFHILIYIHNIFTASISSNLAYQLIFCNKTEYIKHGNILFQDLFISKSEKLLHNSA